MIYEITMMNVKFNYILLIGIFNVGNDQHMVF